ncbi:MAG: rhamnogalacturonan acetylesterase [Acidobacteriota bacterium]
MKIFLFTLATLLASSVCLFSQVKDDPRPVVDDLKAKIETAINPTLPTLFIVGDSTLNSNAPLRGWGQELAQFFDLSKINVINRAIGGRSSRSFQYEGRWDKVLADLKAGDFVILQFGHNDVGKYDDPAAKDRPSLHGEGDDTAEVTRLDGKKELVHMFGWYMRKYGNDVHAKGAAMIFCSMVPHKDWADSHVVRKESETFVKWTQNAAKASGAAYINLNEIVALEFEKLGPDKVAPLFGDARTHSTPAGANLNAQLVVAGIKALKKPNLKKYLSDRSKPIKSASKTLVEKQ